MQELDVFKLLPHRHPMVFIDRIKELDPGKRGVGIKCISYNENFFPGHFPGQAIFPGVLIIESIAQMAAITLADTNAASADDDSQHRAPVYLAKVKNFSFKKPVVPGDTLEVEVVITRRLGDMASIEGIARVDNEEVASGVLSVAG